jgi:hypothetical protein
MTPAQLQTLRTAIDAETDPAFVALRAGNNEQGMADWYNAPSAPAFTIWRTDVRSEEIGDAWNGTDIASMSSLNMQRLQLLLASAPLGVFDMTRADRRAGFEGPFGGTEGNPGPSRLAMRAVWKRIVTRVERLFASGIGSDATPGIAGWQGTISAQTISDALRL